MTKYSLHRNICNVWEFSVIKGFKKVQISPLLCNIYFPSYPRDTFAWILSTHPFFFWCKNDFKLLNYIVFYSVLFIFCFCKYWGVMSTTTTCPMNINLSADLYYLFCRLTKLSIVWSDKLVRITWYLQEINL